MTPTLSHTPTPISYPLSFPYSFSNSSLLLLLLLLSTVEHHHKELAPWHPLTAMVMPLPDRALSNFPVKSNRAQSNRPFNPTERHISSNSIVAVALALARINGRFLIS